MKAGFEFQGIKEFPGSIKYEAQCRAAAKRIASVEIDSNVIAAIVCKENVAWNPTLKSFDYDRVLLRGKWYGPTGSIGLGQATAETQKAYPNYKTDVAVQLYQVGKHLENDLLSFKARPYLPPNAHASATPLYNAIRAYNCGNAGVRRGYNNVPPNYLSIVLGYKKKFEAANTPITGTTTNDAKTKADAVKVANAKKALEVARLKKIADAKKLTDLEDKLHAEDVADTLAETKRLDKLKLSKDNEAYNKQLALDKIAKAKRLKAIADANTLRIKKEKENAAALKNAEHPKKPIVAKSTLQTSIPILGVLAIVLLASQQKKS